MWERVTLYLGGGGRVCVRAGRKGQGVYQGQVCTAAETHHASYNGTIPCCPPPLSVAAHAEQREVLPPLVADEGLVQAALSLEDVDGSVEDAVLQAQKQVQVSITCIGHSGAQWLGCGKVL